MSLDKTAQADSWSELQALEVITNSLMSIVCVPATGSLNCMLSLSSVTVIQREIRSIYFIGLITVISLQILPSPYNRSTAFCYLLSAFCSFLHPSKSCQFHFYFYFTSISINFTSICYLQSISISRLKQNVCLKVLRSLSLDLLGTHNEV